MVMKDRYLNSGFSFFFFILFGKSGCEKELEKLAKELANCKVQLEAKHSAQMQALLKLEHNQKMIHELSTLLKKSDIERNKTVNECSECRACKDELESKVKEIDDQIMETAKVRDQLSHVLSELKATQRELLNKETELVAARDSELNALTNARQLESALEDEIEQKEELLQQVKELHEVIHNSKLADVKAEKEKLAILSEKEETIELATKATAQVQQQLEDMKKHVEMIQGLQNQVMDKSTMQANETIILSEDSAPKAINDSNQSNIDMELKERKIMDQSVYLETLEMELSQLKQELTATKREINSLNITNESLTSELQKANAELNTNKGTDIETQVEIALLKSQLQEHMLAYKNEHVTQVSKTDHSKAKSEERNSENNNDHVTCKCLVEKTNGVQELPELSLMKKDLENASVKIAELRARAEQALSRAEFAENAKAMLEDKIRRHREHRQKRKLALAALREESTPKPFSPSSSYGTPGTYQPLGKVLNMKI